MENFKTLKVSPEVHTAISARADILGIKLQRFTEALLQASLRIPDDEVIEQLKMWSSNNTRK